MTIFPPHPVFVALLGVLALMIIWLVVHLVREGVRERVLRRVTRAWWATGEAQPDAPSWHAASEPVPGWVSPASLSVPAVAPPVVDVEPARVDVSPARVDVEPVSSVVGAVPVRAGVVDVDVLAAVASMTSAVERLDVALVRARAAEAAEEGTLSSTVGDIVGAVSDLADVHRDRLGVEALPPSSGGEPVPSLPPVAVDVAPVVPLASLSALRYARGRVGGVS